MIIRLFSASIALAAALLASACGGNDEGTSRLSASKTERFLSQDASAKLQATIDVDCPNTITAGAGERFTCTATAKDDSSAPLEATQQDGKGNLTWHMDARSTGAIEQEIEVGVRRQKRLRVIVDCPDIIEFDKGGTFECTATRPDGSESEVLVTQTDDKGSIVWNA